MAILRQTWEQTTLRRANNELYALLAACHRIHNDIVNDPNSRKKRREFNEAAEILGFNFKESTKLPGRIVNVVFGKDHCRKLISTYSIAVQAAIEHKVAPDDLPNWLRENNGVHSVSRPDKQKTMPEKDKVSLVKKFIENEDPSGAKVVSEELERLFSPADAGADCLMLVGWEANGTLTVRHVFREGGALKQALLEYYKEKRNEIANAEESQKAAEDSGEMDAAIDDAAA